ncbi:MAG: YigZ family protein [Lachnospiraceae bacterium]|nr:YigZ family protein [Lachnospiraceae bacterium]
MAAEYLTIRETGKGEYEEKKSRFLGEALHIESEEEAAVQIARIRKAFYDARHHCYAWVLGEGGARKKSSDDGEPSGTAGQPILKVIEGSGATNVLVVVTRYFGGTLLGTGGLVRAYTQAARAAMDDAQTVRMCLCRRMEVTVDYPALDRLLYELRRDGIEMGETQYGAQVTLDLTVEAPRADAMAQKITALTSGSARIEVRAEDYFPIQAP